MFNLISRSSPIPLRQAIQVAGAVETILGLLSTFADRPAFNR